MLPTVDASTQTFLDSLSKIGQRMDRAQKEISSGQRFTSVSDNPDQVSTLLQARADLDATKMIQSNLGRIKAEVDGGEQALSTAVSAMERVQTLSAQGATGTQSAETRQTI